MIGVIGAGVALGAVGVAVTVRRRRRAGWVNPGTRAHGGPPPVAERVAVDTSKGPVSGFRAVVEGPIWFRGIPFAAPLVGADLFQPPRPVAPWGPAVRDGLRFGPAVPQDATASTLGITGAPSDPVANYGPPGAESLNLNIVTPAVGAARRAPVLVWIHGGGNKGGSNAESGLFMPGSAFAARGVVGVSLNYRLGLPGFLHLPGQGSSNRAIRDLIAGLEWVRDEIAAFGGDPENVTVYGESAGAVNIATLLASPRARGLFHKAILSSGGANDISPAQAAVGRADACEALRKKRPEVRFREDGEPDIETLTGEAAVVAAGAMKDTLLDAHGVALSPAHFASVVGDDVLPRPILDAIGDGQARGIPLLCGYNSDEFNGFLRCLLGGMGLGPALSAPLIGLVLRRMPGALGAEVMLRHFAGVDRQTPGADDEAMAAAVEALRAELAAGAPADARPRSAWRRWWAVDEGDPAPALLQLLATAGQDALADAQAAHADVYSYTLKLDADLSPKGGNMHGLDLALVFRPDGEFTAAERGAVARAFFGREALGPDLDAVVEGMRDAIVRFMRTGAPGDFAGVDGAPVPWPSHTAGRMVVGPKPAWSGGGQGPARAALDRVVAAHRSRGAESAG